MKSLMKLLLVGAAMATASAYGSYTINPTTIVGTYGSTDQNAQGQNNGTTVPINVENGAVSGTSEFTFNISGTGYTGRELDFVASVSAPNSTVDITGLQISGVGTLINKNLGQSIINGTFSGSQYTTSSSTQSYTYQGNYTVFVDWTCSASEYNNHSWQSYFTVNLNTTMLNVTNGLPANGVVNNDSVGQSIVSAVPEPSQLIAGGMLLGCGGLIFLGRRMMKKQA